MTIQNAASAVTYQGNGSTTVFPYGFPVRNAAHLMVTVLDTTQTPNLLTLLTSSQYSVTGIGAPGGGGIGYPLAGAPLAAGFSLTIRRVVPYTQGTAFPNQGGFYPTVLEDALDGLTMMVQQLSEQATRSVQVPIGSGIDPGSYLSLVQASQSAASSSMVAADDSASSATTAAITATTQAAVASTAATTATTRAAVASAAATTATTQAGVASAAATTATTQAGVASAAATTATTQAGVASTAATTATTQAGIATTAATTATTQASIATTAANTAVNYAAALQATSASAVMIYLAPSTFTIQTGKQFTAGMWVLAVDHNAPEDNWVYGPVISYSGSSLVVDVKTTRGNGVISNWVIMISGPRGDTGPQGSTGPTGSSGPEVLVNSAMEAVSIMGTSSTPIKRYRCLVDALNGTTAIDTANTTMAFDSANKWYSGGTPKFGSNCSRYNGTGYIKYPASASFMLGNDFTIEWWQFIFFLNGSNQTVFSTTSHSNTQNGFCFQLFDQLGCLRLYRPGIDDIIAFGTQAPAPLTWQHMVVCRYSGVMNAYIHGTRVISDSQWNGVNFSDGEFCIGRSFGGSYQQDSPFTGFIDCLRVVNGTGNIYTGTSFTPPATPLTAITNTKLLLQFDGNLTDTSSNGLVATNNGVTFGVPGELRTNSLALTGAATTGATAILRYQDVLGGSVLGTDLRAYASRDGSSWTEAMSYADLGPWDDTYRIVQVKFDLSSQNNGYTLQVRMFGLNGQRIKAYSISGLS